MKEPLPSLKQALRPPIGSVVVAVGLLLTAIVTVGKGHPGMGSAVYHAGALAVLRGQPLNDALPISLPWADLPFTYPPVAAIIFIPLAPFPLHFVWGLMAALCALALGVTVRTGLRSVLGQEPNPWLLTLATLAPFGLLAVWSTVGLGQVNLLLMALVAVDVLAMRGSRYSGVLVGVAASIKLTPLIFIPHLLLTGRRADAGRATATFLALQGFAWLVLPTDSLRFWTSAIMSGNDSRTHEAANQSINGLVQRLTAQAPGASAVSLLLAALCLGLTMWLVRQLHPTQPLAALLVTAFCGLLISPVTWTHDWVWVAPLCVLLAHRAVTRAGWSEKVLLLVVLLVFSVDFRLLVRTGDRLELTWTAAEILVGNSYLWAAVAVGGTGLALLTVRRRLLPAAAAQLRAAPVAAPRFLRRTVSVGQLRSRRRRATAGTAHLTSRTPSRRQSDPSDRPGADQQRR